MRSLFKPIALLLLLSAAPASAGALRSDVQVTGEIVTLGDMFEDAGARASEALFRAPAPGTAGIVGIEAIVAATARIGFANFSLNGVTEVRVARLGIEVDERRLAILVEDDLRRRGILASDMIADTLFSHAVATMTAEAGPEPARLTSLRYLPNTGAFSARFEIAGHAEPLDLSGTIALMVEAPHLASPLPAGTVLQPADIVMRPVPANYAESAGAAPLEDLIGMALRRQSREGMLLKSSDIAEPELISRNETVTLYVRRGPLTLTVKGLALNGAVEGGDVRVLNQTTNKIITGVAVAQGAVELDTSPLAVAGL